MSGFDTILVANRSEIALRIMRTARSMGLKCVAVFTDADADAPHVSFADQAVNIGVGPVGDSYLSIPQIITAAQETGAQAVHPGYGFLSENADFASACDAAGLTFVGPPARAIEAMADKARARIVMRDAGVPVMPGYDGADQDDDTLAAQAVRIGWPVMIKAALGGGGRGMRLVTGPADFAQALSVARSEAEAAFGAGQVILEKAVTHARHIEVQVMADARGHTIHLGERDCSLQRRHQKVIEEAPAPALPVDLREAMSAAAVQAAQAIQYVGAGTVEFLLDPSGAFYFLEMNTRLQVEHPVTEAVTGLDLVEMQLRIARGEALTLQQHDVTFTGHAIEARIYAEDPSNGFLPSAGRILDWRPPSAVRVDAGIAAGQDVSPFYDPMLAKIIAHGTTRDAARHKLLTALRETVLIGLPSNRDFLAGLLEFPEFVAGEAETGTLERQPAPQGRLSFADHALAAALWYVTRQDQAAARAGGLSAELLGWSSAGALATSVVLDGERLHLVQERDGGLFISGKGEKTCRVHGSGQVWRVQGARVTLLAWRVTDSAVHVVTDQYSCALPVGRTISDQTAQADGRVTAPMHGQLTEVLAAIGAQVTRGQRLAILEAMKMQHEIIAPRDGTVTQAPETAPCQVRAGALLFEIGKS